VHKRLFFAPSSQKSAVIVVVAGLNFAKRFNGLSTVKILPSRGSVPPRRKGKVISPRSGNDVVTFAFLKRIPLALAAFEEAAGRTLRSVLQFPERPSLR